MYEVPVGVDVPRSPYGLFTVRTWGASLPTLWGRVSAVCLFPRFVVTGYTRRNNGWSLNRDLKGRRDEVRVEGEEPPEVVDGRQPELHHLK